MRPRSTSLLPVLFASAPVVIAACEPSTTPTPPVAPVSSAAAPGPSATPSAAPSAAPAATDAGAAGASTLFVAEDVVDCEGEGPRKCLRVRTSESAPWRLFYGRIDGFTHEPGTTYELRVAVAAVEKPPADAPAKRYRLVEVVSKRKVGSSGGK